MKEEEKWLPQHITELVVNSTNPGEVSDGYHTFNELYDHRITLWIALLRTINGVIKLFDSPYMKKDGWDLTDVKSIWRSKAHSDGSVWDGWFILGTGTEPGKQITYHLPIDRWDECDFAQTLEKAPEYDDHTSGDVLERLKQL